MSDIASKDDFARNLRYYVERTGRSQREVAESLGIAQPTFNCWCRGSKFPRIDKIEMLANYFGISKSDLIEKKTDAKGTDLSPSKRKLIDLANGCSEEEAERLLQMMQLFLEK